MSERARKEEIAIWCVEDDAGIREVELYTLKQIGFETKGLADGAELQEALEHGQPDLLLLDVMLPGEDGISILKRLRASPRTKELPVIMATAKGMEYDKVRGLDLGADDYLVKPFGMLEMAAHVKAVLRRCKPQEEQRVLRQGSLLLKPDEYTAAADGIPLTLTRKEYELLKVLLSHPGTVYTREQLFAQVWGSDYVGESRTVDVHVRTLRQKLGRCGEMIQTVRGVGYRLEADEQ